MTRHFGRTGLVRWALCAEFLRVVEGLEIGGGGEEEEAEEEEVPLPPRSHIQGTDWEDHFEYPQEEGEEDEEQEEEEIIDVAEEAGFDASEVEEKAAGQTRNAHVHLHRPRGGAHNLHPPQGEACNEGPQMRSMHT